MSNPLRPTRTRGEVESLWVNCMVVGLTFKERVLFETTPVSNPLGESFSMSRRPVTDTVRGDLVNDSADASRVALSQPFGVLWNKFAEHMREMS